MYRSSWLGVVTLFVVAVGACSAVGGAEPTTSTTVVAVAPTVVEEAPVRAVVGWREVADLPFGLTGTLSSEQLTMALWLSAAVRPILCAIQERRARLRSLRVP
jgi:hypothetical protein